MIVDNHPVLLLLVDTRAWSCKTDGWPNVDVFPVYPKEAARRLAWFSHMKKLGNKDGGLLAKAFKSELGAWGSLWYCLNSLDKEREDGSP